MFRDYLKLHFIVFLWGFTAVLGKLISLPPVELVCYRTLLATAFLALLFALRRQPWRLPVRQALPLLGVGALVSTHWILFFLAARLSSVSVCLAGTATLALWTSLLEPLMLRKRVQPFELLLGVLALLGLYLVSQAQLSQLTGLLVAVVAAGVCALFSVLNVQQTKLHSPLRLTLYEMAGAWLTVVVLLAGQTAYTGTLPQLAPLPLDWVWLLVLAGVCTVYAFSASAELMKRLSAFTVNLTINLEPLYGITLAVLIFGQREHMRPGFYFGTLLIIASVLAHPLFNYWALKKAAPQPAPPEKAAK